MDPSRRQRTQTRATAEEQALDQIAQEDEGVAPLGGRPEGRPGRLEGGGAPASTTGTRQSAGAGQPRPRLPDPRIFYFLRTVRNHSTASTSSNRRAHVSGNNASGTPLYVHYGQHMLHLGNAPGLRDDDE